MTDSKRTIVAAGPGFSVWADGGKTTIELDHAPAYLEPMPERRGPSEASKRYYLPHESPPRWPLELRSANGQCAIMLWEMDGSACCTIAYWAITDECAELVFVGSRPLNSRVSWTHFRELVVTGQRIADEIWQQQKDGQQ